MDIDTGKIRDLSLNDKLNEREVEIDKRPDSNCKDCLGRGHITKVIPEQRVKEPCHCVANSPKSLVDIKARFVELRKESSNIQTVEDMGNNFKKAVAKERDKNENH